MDIVEKIISQQRKAVDMGFFWDDANQIINHARLELDEVQAELEKGSKDALQEELGDVIHICLILIDFCGFNAKETLEFANNKFTNRFQFLKDTIKEECVGDFKNLSREEKIVFWKKAKQREKEISFT